MRAKAKRRIGALLWLAAIVALLAGPYVTSRLRSSQRQLRIVSGATEAADEPTIIRGLPYNIAHGRGAVDGHGDDGSAPKRRRIEQIAAVIAAEDADVVVLNEVDFASTWSGLQNQAEAIADAGGYAHRVEQRNFDLQFIDGSWKFGNAVLSRFPIVDAELMEFPVLSEWERLFAGAKQGVVCTLQLSPAVQVRVAAVHFETRSEAVRVGSARVLIAAGETGPPMIAAGDFNSTPGDFPGAERSGVGNAMDLLADSELFQMQRSPPTENEMTFSSTQPRSVIDWILAPARFRLEHYHVLASDLSDHRAVVANVELAPTSE